MTVMDNTNIQTTKKVYPQIYAYVIPNYPNNEGWIKIGYTEQQNVDDRIKQQTQTAGISYEKLWSGPAQYLDGKAWFTDKNLHAYLRKFKAVEQRANSEWFYYDGYPERAKEDFNEFRGQKISQVKQEYEYQLRSEQATAVEQTIAYFKQHPGGEFLWNAKPRFGKTLTTYDMICQMGLQKVLIVTNRPAIANSWFDDFEDFIAWQNDYLFVSTSDSLNERSAITRKQYIDECTTRGKSLGMIYFVSLQDLKGAISFGGSIDKLDWVKKLDWDMLVIDEAHEGIDTFKTDVAFENITRDYTLHLSGTPFKAIGSGKFRPEQIYNWSYADEQEAKELWVENSEINNPYAELPRLNLFSYQMSAMITEEVNKGTKIGTKEIDYAFDLNEFFQTKSDGKFEHEAAVKKWLDTLSRNEKYPFSTPELRAELKHTFWLLDRVASAKALEKLLKQHPVFENYHIILAAGDGRSAENDAINNQKSLDRVKTAIKNHEKTITLSVGQLTTGVTIPEWTAVLMLSNVKSSSLYMQAAFRAQNPWTYATKETNYRKQNAYVFDFAPERTLIIYDEFANNLLSKTAAGSGTSADREDNIKKLLNFFPVIAEDHQGKMVELDVKQVLTIPKTLKAQEVVNRGFMSNFLFQNISGIFASAEAREILENLNPVEVGKVVPVTKSTPIDTQNVNIDTAGKPVVDHNIVIATTEAKMGAKVFENIVSTSQESSDQTADLLGKTVASTFTYNILESVKEIAKDNQVTVAQAQQIVKSNAEILEREVKFIRQQTEIRDKELALDYQREVAEAADNATAVAAAQTRYEQQKAELTQQYNQTLRETITQKAVQLAQKSTQEVLMRAEESKKENVEEDIRSRLRGFARTIPSFLMAYGNSETKLANFDKHIADHVFKDVTGISLEQFRALRDKHNFFDSVVFDHSVQEFLSKKEQLANYFDPEQSEDIFDYIPPQKTNQIFTPRWVVNMMLDKLEDENPGIFSDPQRTFADLYLKSGLYLTEITKRLYVGLKNQIPQDNERLKHILEKQLYGFAPSEIIYAIAKNFIYGQFAEINPANLQCRDLTELAKEDGDLEMKFDVVVGNPPYQEEAKGTSTKDMPIYDCFYDLAERVADKYCLISPARFLFNAGGTRKAWNEKMLNDKHLKVEYYVQKSDKVFAGPDIKGGVVVIQRDAHKNFGKIGVFTTFEELNTILGKVKPLITNALDEVISNRGSYRFADLVYEHFPEEMKRASDRRISTNAFEILPELFTDEKPDDTSEYVQIFGRVENDRGYKWFKRDYLFAPPNFDKFKVIIPKANGSGAIGEVLSTPLVGEPLVGEPLVGFTETFISIGAFDKQIEAENCLKYVKSKFARAMLGVLKVTQDNTKEKWVYVPLQNFSPQSDIDWSQTIAEIDAQLYAKYGLSPAEIDFIEEKVRAMD